MALVATVGASTSNSYVTQALADTYFGDHPATAIWTALTSAQQDQNLILATTQIDAMPLVGEKNDTAMTSGVPDQRLHFPTTEDVDDSTEFIPLPVQLATYEQALYIGNASMGTWTTRQTLQAQGVVEAEFADVREKYAEGGASSGHGELCARAYQILNNAGLLRWGGGLS